MTCEEKLIRWPFLQIENVSNIDYADDYSDGLYIWELPSGWDIAFGKLMWDEIKAELDRCGITDWRIFDLKEKFGEMRCYHSGAYGSKVDDIIDKYTTLSRNICIGCGKPDVPMLMRGWFDPMCERCYRKIIRVKTMSDEDIHTRYLGETGGSSSELSKYLCFSRWSAEDEEWKNQKIDISDTAEKIRNHWKAISSKGEADADN